jgi:exodeoxyribonuclease III
VVVGVSLGVPTLTEADGTVAKEVMAEGRTITVEYESFYVVASYVPNSGDKLQRLDFRTKVWDKRMGEYLVDLEKRKPVIFCGDLNVAHLDSDIWNVGAKHLTKSAGTTPEERQSFSDLLALGFVDAFRQLNPEAAGWFSYWSVRAGNRPFNRGLRLDYFVTSPKLCGEVVGGAEVKEVVILPEFVAIDHAAIALTVAL